MSGPGRIFREAGCVARSFGSQFFWALGSCLTAQIPLGCWLGWLRPQQRPGRGFVSFRRFRDAFHPRLLPPPGFCHVCLSPSRGHGA